MDEGDNTRIRIFTATSVVSVFIILLLITACIVLRQRADGTTKHDRQMLGDEGVEVLPDQVVYQRADNKTVRVFLLPREFD